ncbi:MAG TPA: hypothetical protein GX400_10130 [Chloroflexi bacterium]|nr:hypothetical protein [Chloroflexota bacterium]
MFHSLYGFGQPHCGLLIASCHLVLYLAQLLPETKVHAKQHYSTLVKNDYLAAFLHNSDEFLKVSTAKSVRMSRKAPEIFTVDYKVRHIALKQPILYYSQMQITL